MTRAVSWAAVSSKPQLEGESLADQHARNRELAEAHGWELLCELTVPGESRSYYRLSDAMREVQAYRELDTLARSKALDWLVVKDRSRLGRTRRLNAEVAALLQDHGVRVWSRAIPPSSLEGRTEADVWAESIEAGYSEAEILRLKQRHAMGMRARTLKGRLPNVPPWGFRREGERLVFDDSRAEATVRYVITQFLRGIPKNRIVAEAHARGLRSPTGRPMASSTIHQIIYQPAYYGLASYGKVRIIHEDGKRRKVSMPIDKWIISEGDWDAPFTPDDWERVVAEHERRLEEHPRTRAARYPLSRIAWCVECQRWMIGTASGHAVRHRYYRCSRYNNWGASPEPPLKTHYIRADRLHRAVVAYMASITDADLLGTLADRQQDTGAMAEERERLAQQMDDLTARRQRWQAAYESGVIELAEFARRLDELDVAEEAVARDIERCDHQMQRTRRASDLAAEMQRVLSDLPERIPEELSPEQAQRLRAIFRRLFQRIVVTPGGEIVRVEWRL